MKKILTEVGMVASAVLLVGASQVLANEPKGGAPDYSGISGIYYTFIGFILAYGVYDTFFKKN